MDKILHVSLRSVYGNVLVYPVNEVAHKFADLLEVKTFSARQRRDIKALGYEFVQVTQEVAL